MPAFPRRLVCLSILTALCALSSPASPQEDEASRVAPNLPAEAARGWDEVAAWLTAEMETQGVVGGSLYLTHRGRTVRHLHHGMADLEEARPVDADTIFHWGSITKTLTAVGLLQLRDRGLLTLDDPIVRYLPELRGVHNPYAPIEEITLRHLLSHTGGFRAATWPWGGREDWHPHEPTRWEQLVAMIPYTRTYAPPGGGFGYSNLGIVFLAQVIEQLTGDDIEVYLEKNVLRPLDMRRSYFDRTPYHLLHHRSNNYFVEKGSPRPNGLDFDTGITASNSGLNAPLPDMVRWLEFLLGHGPGVEGWPDAPHGVLARASLEEMWRPVAPVNKEPGKEEWMGLSFFLLDRDGHRYVGHLGSQRGFVAYFYIDPERDAGFIGVFNTVGSGGRNGPDTGSLRLEVSERLIRDVLARL